MEKNPLLHNSDYFTAESYTLVDLLTAQRLVPRHFDELMKKLWEIAPESEKQRIDRSVEPTYRNDPLLVEAVHREYAIDQYIGRFAVMHSEDDAHHM